jgi:hypothetical protein
MGNLSSNPTAELRSPREIRKLLDGLSAISKNLCDEKEKKTIELTEVSQRVALAPRTEAALQRLSDQMFETIVKSLESSLTIALQEVLEQPIELKAVASYKRNTACVEFHVERDGHEENIMKGQGGSVANVLSVGLRMFALASLDPSRHRRFLVLDEQDCWLRPELVPKLVKIVRDACENLGFQILMISHHDHKLFEEYAGKMYSFIPQPDGSVNVELIGGLECTRLGDPPGFLMENE